MSFRQYLLRLTNWLHNRLSTYGDNDSPQLSDEGLMIDQNSYAPAKNTDNSTTPGEDKNNAIEAVALPRRSGESLEKLQAGFDRLIDELAGINDHLRKQVAQHEELIVRVDQLPKLVESFPASVESQKQLTEHLISQLKSSLLKDQQLLSAVEKIPAEAARQTDTLTNIDRQLAAAANVDIQMTDTFNKFNQSLEKLNKATREHSEGISQMSRTFAASDRYLKFIVSRQRRQFMWVFYSAVVVCVLVILALVGIVIYLSR
ncbi:MAG: hypothetical protein JW749_08650 [Sedimentisphaerales bacterium]|nr:hypothetical protein [Sedimentisphaerales bacterium]